jgi:hypothetical protein
MALGGPPVIDDVALVWAVAEITVTDADHQRYVETFSPAKVARANKYSRLAFDRPAFRSAVPKALSPEYLFVLKRTVFNALLEAGKYDERMARFRIARTREKKAQNAARMLRSLGHDDMALALLKRESSLPKVYPVTTTPKGRPRKHALVYFLENFLKRCEDVTPPQRHRLIAAIVSPLMEGRVTSERVRELTKNIDRMKPLRSR